MVESGYVVVRKVVGSRLRGGACWVGRGNNGPLGTEVKIWWHLHLHFPFLLSSCYFDFDFPFCGLILSRVGSSVM